MGNKQDEETTLPIIVPDKKQGMPQEPVAESETTSHSGWYPQQCPVANRRGLFWLVLVLKCVKYGKPAKKFQEGILGVGTGSGVTGPGNASIHYPMPELLQAISTVSIFRLPLVYSDHLVHLFHTINNLHSRNTPRNTLPLNRHHHTYRCNSSVYLNGSFLIVVGM